MALLPHTKKNMDLHLFDIQNMKFESSQKTTRDVPVCRLCNVCLYEGLSYDNTWWKTPGHVLHSFHSEHIMGIALGACFAHCFGTICHLVYSGVPSKTSMIFCLLTLVQPFKIFEEWQALLMERIIRRKVKTIEYACTYGHISASYTPSAYC